MKITTILSHASQAKRESKHVDFKACIDVDVNGEWLEVMKDLVAMANSGGGVILFGSANDGSALPCDHASLLIYDPAKLTDKLASYTGRHFSDFQLKEIPRAEGGRCGLIVEDSGMPLVFTKAGGYRSPEGKEKTAFQQGAVYFRHGAKSEPATQDDLRDVIERQVEARRKQWFNNMRKVTHASPDQEVVVVKRIQGASMPSDVSRIGRVVSTKDAPAVYPENADELWPFRAKDLLRTVNRRLNLSPGINGFDLQCLRAVYQLDTKHRDFFYRPFAQASPQYSRTFVDWLAVRYKQDTNFFDKTREQYRILPKKGERTS